ncbi:MAG: type II toxin-antitoxin system HicB family antitoxin [Firmicutes bacterium]|nr:type II toxin-antitoxin system HicB family antitoxin [Bacillota bacterium]
MISFPGRFGEESNGFWIEFPDLPGCATDGDTIQELTSNATEALSLHLRCMLEDNDEIPEPSDIKGEDIIYITPRYEVALPIILRKSREDLRLRQADVAEKMKIPYQTYQKLERAKPFNPTLKTLEKVASSLGKKLVIDIV